MPPARSACPERVQAQSRDDRTPVELFRGHIDSWSLETRILFQNRNCGLNQEPVYELGNPRQSEAAPLDSGH